MAATPCAGGVRREVVGHLCGEMAGPRPQQVAGGQRERRPDEGVDEAGSREPDEVPTRERREGRGRGGAERRAHCRRARRGGQGHGQRQDCERQGELLGQYGRQGDHCRDPDKGADDPDGGLLQRRPPVRGEDDEHGEHHPEGVVRPHALERVHRETECDRPSDTVLGVSVEGAHGRAHRPHERGCVPLGARVRGGADHAARSPHAGRRARARWPVRRGRAARSATASRRWPAARARRCP